MEKKFTEIKESGRTTYVFQRNNFGITHLIIDSVIPSACYEITVMAGRRKCLNRTGSMSTIETIRDRILHDIHNDIYMDAAKVGLTDDERTYYQLSQQFNDIIDDLNGAGGFFETAPRLASGAVDWDSVSSGELENYENLQEQVVQCAGRMTQYAKDHNVDIERIIRLLRVATNQ